MECSFVRFQQNFAKYLGLVYHLAMLTQRRFYFPAVTAAVLIPFSITFVDRPLSTWSHAVLHRPEWAVWLQYIPEPFPPLAGLVLAMISLAAAIGWKPDDRTRIMIATAIATLLAVILKDQLKHLFGRPWPETWVDHNPSWITDGIFGFFPLHGGEGWASFPSGHTTVVTAPCLVLWARMRRLRVLWGGLIVATVVGLIAADYHFLSDCLAGFYLGMAVAAGTLGLIDPEHDAVDIEV